MKWNKLGQIYVADGRDQWAQSHAFIPVPLELLNVIRVFVAFLDQHKIGRIGCVDLDKNDLLKVVHVSDKPFLDVGEKGAFDEHGVTPLSIIQKNGECLLYYAGWQRREDVRYTLFLGLAQLHTPSSHLLTRYSTKPILEPNDQEQYIRTGAFVLPDNGKYKMWYAGGGNWVQSTNKQIPTYALRYLESPDGLSWNNPSTVCLEPGSEDEIGFGRPFITKEHGSFQMWYSIRTLSKGYRLGYAESVDGLTWERKDNQAGIDVSPEGWDSEMICFGSIFELNNKKYMVYNGNNYGETGFGLAVLENE